MKSMLLFFMTIVFLIITACNGANTKSLTDLPVIHNAFDVQRFNDRPAKGAKAVIYKVATHFPAEEVTNLLDQEMQKKGFKRYLMPSQAGRSFSWTTLNPTTGIWDKTDKVPARFLASWTNENRDEIAWIVIDYSPHAKIAKWEATAQVSFQIAKLTDFNKDSEAVDKMLHNQIQTGQATFGI